MASLVCLGFTRARVKRCFLISYVSAVNMMLELWPEWAYVKRLSLWSVHRKKKSATSELVEL